MNEFILLTRSQMQNIHEQSINLLSTKGIKIFHEEMLKKLAEAGAQIDLNTKMVFIPEKLINHCLILAPKNFVLAAPDPKFDIVLPHPEGQFYARCNTGAKGCIDLHTGQFRKITISDTEAWVRAVNKMNNIEMCAIPSAEDKPAETRDIHSLKCGLVNSQKHIMIQPYSIKSLDYLIEMAALISGGNQNLKERPIVSISARSLPPLTYTCMDIEVIITACKYGIPLHLNSYVIPGGTSPFTISGSLLQSNVELLAGLTIAQTLHPKLPVIFASNKLPMDMSTGIPLLASIEAALANAATAQLIREFYHLPFRTYGLAADAPFPDGQSMIERTLTCILPALVRADILIGAGGLECANSISLLQLVIDNDILGMLHRIIDGIRFSDDELAVSIISKVGPGGHFLSEEHTLRHCRDAFQPATFYRGIRNDYENNDIMSKAKEKILSIFKEHSFIHVSESLNDELNAIVQNADKCLVK